MPNTTALGTGHFDFVTTNFSRLLCDIRCLDYYCPRSSYSLSLWFLLQHCLYITVNNCRTELTEACEKTTRQQFVLFPSLESIRRDHVWHLILAPAHIRGMRMVRYVPFCNVIQADVLTTV